MGPADLRYFSKSRAKVRCYIGTDPGGMLDYDAKLTAERPNRAGYISDGGIRVKIKITEECIACDACVDVCPEVFYMGDDGFAHAKEDEANKPELAEKIREAADSCPTEAIIIE